MIISLHTMSSTMNAGGFYISDFYYQAHHILHQFLFTAVSLFIMVTGAAFLDEEHSCSYKDMWRHILKIACCIVFFGSVFFIVRMMVEGQTFGLGDVIRAVLEDRTWSHMWYLYRLLGLYLCLPVLAAFMRLQGREQFAFCVILLLFTCVYPYISGTIGLNPAKIMHISGTWFFYAAAGGFLGNLSCGTLKRYRWMIVMSILVGALWVFWEGMQGVTLSEEHPSFVLFAVGLFSEAKILSDDRSSPVWLEALAKTMLGVYIIHPVCIHLCLRVLQFNPQYHMPVLTVPLTILVIYAVSVGVVMLLQRIPIVRKYLL